jgi:hypothetical protein
VAQILEFPSQQAQGLYFLEQRLRALLEGKGADEELVEFANQTLSEIYQRTVAAENYRLGIALPEGLSDAGAEQLQQDIRLAVELLRDDNHTIIVHLVAELVLAHVKIFQYERD